MPCDKSRIGILKTFGQISNLDFFYYLLKSCMISLPKFQLLIFFKENFKLANLKKYKAKMLNLDSFYCLLKNC